MINRKAFFAAIRASVFRGRMAPAQVDGMTRLLDVWENEHAARPVEWLAYCLATAYHETAHTMQPVREIGKGAGREYGRPINGLVYYGRGHVQLTWKRNYVHAGNKLGIPLADKPELALNPTNSARIMFLGMIEGWFTGKGLGDYGPTDFVGMRRIVNGTDKAALIAGYAEAFHEALTAADGADAEKPADKVTTEKPVSQSTTIWAQIGAAVAAVLGAVGNVVTDWRVLTVVAAVVVIGAAVWTIRERVRKMREEGV